MIIPTTIGRLCPRRSSMPNQTPRSSSASHLEGSQPSEASIQERLSSSLKKCFEKETLSPEEELVGVEKKSYLIQELANTAGLIKGAYSCSQGKVAIGVLELGLSLSGLVSTIKKHVANCRQLDPEERTSNRHTVQLQMNGIFLAYLTITEIDQLVRDDLSPLDKIASALIASFGAYSVNILLNHCKCIETFRFSRVVEELRSRSIPV